MIIQYQRNSRWMIPFRLSNNFFEAHSMAFRRDHIKFFSDGFVEIHSDLLNSILWK